MEVRVTYIKWNLMFAASIHASALLPRPAAGARQPSRNRSTRRVRSEHQNGRGKPSTCLENQLHTEYKRKPEPKKRNQTNDTM